MAQAFAAQVQAWVLQTEGALEAVWKQSAQEVVNVAQTPRGAGGRMRVDTGFLRASLMASTASVPAINPSAKPKKGQIYPYTGAEVEAVIAGAALGQTLHFGYTAAYAGAREYTPPRGGSPDAFVRTAAQQWPEIVRRQSALLSARLTFT